MLHDPEWSRQKDESGQPRTPVALDDASTAGPEISGYPDSVRELFRGHRHLRAHMADHRSGSTMSGAGCNGGEELRSSQSSHPLATGSLKLPSAHSPKRMEPQRKEERRSSFIPAMEESTSAFFRVYFCHRSSLRDSLNCHLNGEARIRRSGLACRCVQACTSREGAGVDRGDLVSSLLCMVCSGTHQTLYDYF